jgi:nuclear transport factor 2 (NTF2) superfamily protein
MYCDDPALMYRTYGMPEAEIPEEGLAIGRSATAMDRYIYIHLCIYICTYT